MGGLVNRLRTTFPDREFFMRSQGQVRFIRISSRLQIAAVAGVAALLLLWLAAMAAIAILQFTATRERIALQEREAKLASAEKTVSRYRGGVEATAADLARRQDFIEQVVEAHLGELPPEGAQTAPSAAPTHKISAAISPAATLARIEARQLAFVDRLTRIADLRASRAIEAIRKVGLNPGPMLDGKAARGGPLLALATDRNGRVDPRFRRLGSSLARMSALERGLDGIPNVDPAHASYISSGFGYRSDPFSGEAALHSGLDFAGPYGAPIYAAANGKVSFAGIRQGYGNCVEIDHGNGLMTRYAHMSAFSARVGQEVEAGARIGAIGSTGRSTGPHLHFEVRINDRPVNPRPFLEARSHVSEKDRAAALARR